MRFIRPVNFFPEFLKIHQGVIDLLFERVCVIHVHFSGFALLAVLQDGDFPPVAQRSSEISVTTLLPMTFTFSYVLVHFPAGE